MVITSINLNGLELISDDYYFNLGGLFDLEKDIQTSDILTNGMTFGRSKIKAKTLPLNGYIKSFDESKVYDLNAALTPNGLKELIINNQYKCYVEVANRASDSNDSRIISCQLTMPDPYLYALNPKSVQLGAQYSTGVAFGESQGVIFGPRSNFFNPAVGSVTINGVTVTIAADGTIKAAGTATADTYITVTSALANGLILPTSPILRLILGQQYTISATVLSGTIDSTSNLHYLCLSEITSYPSGYITAGGIAQTKTFTAGTPADTGWSSSLNVGLISLHISSGTVFDNYTFRLKLEQGSTTPWTPYSDEGAGAIFGTATGEAGTLTNGGNADAYPVITIVGACSGISVTNQTTGESISVSGSLANSDTLVIDCRPSTRGIYFNGVQSMALKSGAGWIHCPPGDNVFSFSRNSLENKKHCTVELQSRWI